MFIINPTMNGKETLKESTMLGRHASEREQRQNI